MFQRDNNTTKEWKTMNDKEPLQAETYMKVQHVPLLNKNKIKSNKQINSKALVSFIIYVKHSVYT
jgi:hypothetical protein